MNIIDFNSLRKIAVIRRNGLGDLLCTLPLLNLLKIKAPLAKIWLIVDQNNASLIPYLSGYDHLYILAKGNRYKALLKLGLEARRWGLDLAISAKTSPMKLMNFILLATQARQRLAYVDSSWHSRLITHKYTYNETNASQRHQALKGLNLIDPNLTEISEELYPKITIPEFKKQQYLSGLIEKLKTIHSLSVPTLMVSVTNRRPTSTISLAMHAELLNELANQFAFKVVISAEPKDEATTIELKTKLNMPSCAVITHSFDEFMLLLSLVDLLLIGDGGIMHLAAALNKPQVVLFGKTRISEWQPLSKLALCHYHPEHVQKIAYQPILASLAQHLSRL